MAESLADKLARAEAGARTAPPAPGGSTGGSTSGPGPAVTGGTAGEFDFGDDVGGSDAEEEFAKQFGSNPFGVTAAAIDSLEDQFMAGATTLGWDENIAAGWFDQQRMALATYLNDELLPQVFGGQNQEGSGVGMDDQANTLWDFEIVKKFGQNWLSGLSPQVRDAFNPNLAGANSRRSGGGGGGRRGGGGARKPTAEELRAQFDIDQLSETVQNMWRGMVLDNAKDPRGIASAYIESVVATGGEQKIDFETFVLGRIRKDPRYNQIYKNKPESMSEGQFLSPYVNQASQVLRPKNVAETARAGAQLGSSPSAFRGRLGRSEEATASTPFITQMEANMTDLGKVFRG